MSMKGNLRGYLYYDVIYGRRNRTRSLALTTSILTVHAYYWQDNHTDEAVI